MFTSYGVQLIFTWTVHILIFSKLYSEKSQKTVTLNSLQTGRLATKWSSSHTMDQLATYIQKKQNTVCHVYCSCI